MVSVTPGSAIQIYRLGTDEQAQSVPVIVKANDRKISPVAMHWRILRVYG
jgi:hypothetical protein